MPNAKYSRDPSVPWIFMTYETATNVRQRSASWGKPRLQCWQCVMWNVLGWEGRSLAWVMLMCNVLGRSPARVLPNISQCSGKFPPMNWHKLNHVFNRTMTFRRDSDVVIRYNYHSRNYCQVLPSKPELLRYNHSNINCCPGQPCKHELLSSTTIQTWIVVRYNHEGPP